MSTALVKTSAAMQMVESAKGLEATLGIMEKLVDFGCLPKGMSPAEGMLCASMGHKFGWNPLEACQRFHVINGTLSMKADVMVGVAKAHPACMYFRCIESTDERATYETHRHGSPDAERETFTMADAKRAGLLSNRMWGKYPRQMLRARCSAGLARLVYSDILAGIYTPDEGGRPDIELSDILDAEFTEQPRQPARQPSSPPRREQPGAGAGGEPPRQLQSPEQAERDRQAELDAEFNNFMRWATESGIAVAYLIAGQVIGRPEGMAFMRAWNSPAKWREESRRLSAIFSDSSSGRVTTLPMRDAQVLSNLAADLMAEAMTKAGRQDDEAEAFTALQHAIRDAAQAVVAEGKMADTDAANRAAAACLIAERCIRKPRETFKALGLHATALLAKESAE